MNNLMVIDGIEVRRDVYGRYSLNDLHRAVGICKGISISLHSSATNEQTERLPTPELQICNPVNIEPVNVSHGETKGERMSAKNWRMPGAMWISLSFHLKVIRTFDMVTSAPENYPDRLLTRCRLA